MSIQVEAAHRACFPKRPCDGQESSSFLVEKPHKHSLATCSRSPSTVVSQVDRMDPRPDVSTQPSSTREKNVGHCQRRDTSQDS